jgi:hypothetical protein
MSCNTPAALGVAMRMPNSDMYTTEPSDLSLPMVNAIRALGPAVGVGLASEITAAAFLQLSPYQTVLNVQPRGISIPILNSLDDVPAAAASIRGNFACMLRQEKVLLLWSNAVESILQHAADVETKLLGSVRFAYMSPAVRAALMELIGMGLKHRRSWSGVRSPTLAGEHLPFTSVDKAECQSLPLVSEFSDERRFAAEGRRHRQDYEREKWHEYAKV